MSSLSSLNKYLSHTTHVWVLEHCRSGFDTLFVSVVFVQLSIFQHGKRSICPSFLLLNLSSLCLASRWHLRLQIG